MLLSRGVVLVVLVVRDVVSGWLLTESRLGRGTTRMPLRRVKVNELSFLGQLSA